MTRLLESARHCMKREDHPEYKWLQRQDSWLIEKLRWDPRLQLAILELEKAIEDDLREPYCPAFHRIMREVSPKKGLTEDGMVQLAEVIHKVIDESRLVPEFPIKREIGVALDKWFDTLEF